MTRLAGAGQFKPLRKYQYGPKGGKRYTGGGGDVGGRGYYEEEDNDKLFDMLRDLLDWSDPAAAAVELTADELFNGRPGPAGEVVVAGLRQKGVPRETVDFIFRRFDWCTRWQVLLAPSPGHVPSVTGDSRPHVPSRPRSCSCLHTASARMPLCLGACLNPKQPQPVHARVVSTTTCAARCSQLPPMPHRMSRRPRARQAAAGPAPLIRVQASFAAGRARMSLSLPNTAPLIRVKAS